MPCALPDGVELRFMDSLLSVEPEEIDVRSRERHYAHGTFKLSESQGKKLQNRVENDVVILYYDGNAAARFVSFPDSLSFKTSLENETYAELRLYDARKILTNGNFNKNYSKTTLRDVVSDILGAANDPHDVINGFTFINEETAEEGETAAYAQLTGEGLGQDTETVDEGLLSLPRHLIGGIIDAAPGLGDINSAIEFSNMTPLAAMEKLMNEFSLDWWITLNGTVVVGVQGTYNKLYGIKPDSRDIALQRYTVTQSGSVTDTVKVNGSYKQISGTDVDNTNLYPIAEATTFQFEGSTKELDYTPSTNNPRKVEAIALRELLSEAREDVSGSFVINGMASNDKAGIAAMDVGDRIYVDPDVGDRCVDEVVTGMFMITDLHHQINPRRGWDINVSVQRTVDPSSLSVQSVYYDPQEDKAYEDLAAYRENNESGFKTAQEGVLPVSP